MRCITFLIDIFMLFLTIVYLLFRKMFEACEAFVSYETGLLDRQGFEVNDEPVWILGRNYDTTTHLNELNADVKSRMWFTYRRNFPSISDSGMTSDKGWGCMLRCGQMVVAQALLNHHLGRDPFWPMKDDHPVDQKEKYLKILNLFQDKKTSTYSIHQLAQMGVSEGKEVGQWFGPNTVAQVLKKLSVYDEWSSLKIHVAMDNTVVTEEIELLCQGEEKDSIWNPLLLVIPLRLGLLNINPIYIDALKACLQMPQSVGMIGGKPSQALYFIGYVGDDVVFLDPHVTQNFIDFEDEEQFSDETYHPETCSRINFQSMDPSLALCFSCTTRSEWLDLLQRLQAMNEADKKQNNLFEVCTQRQTEWLPSSSNSELLEGAIALDSAESEDEFEILG